MTKHLFAYGTLQHPDIISFVLHRTPEAQSAILSDFVRYGIKDENFPGIIPYPNALTDGTLFLAITEEEWTRLDEYESDLYERKTVQVATSAGDTVKAEAYVIPEQNKEYLTRDLWDFKEYQPRT